MGYFKDKKNHKEILNFTYLVCYCGSDAAVFKLFCMYYSAERIGKQTKVAGDTNSEWGKREKEP